MIRIKLFGNGEAYYYDRSLPSFPNQLASHLLCYLLLNGRRPHARDRLAAIFWGDSPTQIARKNLRHALWSLRQVLQSAGIVPDQYLLVSDEYVAFVHSSPYWLDTEDFEARINACQHLAGHEMNLDQTTALELAVDLYVGDLLDGIYEDWCLYDRERLRSLYLSALQKLLIFHAVNGAYERSMDFGSRLLAQDSTQEKVHRQIMCLHWLNANPGAALAQYKRCYQIMHEEFGSAPLKETSHLYEQMLHNRVESKAWLFSQHLLFGQPEVKQMAAEPATDLLQKLHELKQKISETGVELLQLEALIHQSLLKPR